MYIDIPLSRSK